MIGANLKAIKKGEDRLLFRGAMEKIGVKTCPSGVAENMEQVKQVFIDVIKEFPAIIRPAYTLGGTGGGIAYNMEQYLSMAAYGLECSPISQILVETSLLGWKEYELEVVRDTADNVVIICSIENFDPMGVHTGDSITVAPTQTLTDKEFQKLRDQSIAIIREIGVDTGGSNIQFSVNPANGDIIVIEMNPRVSRSSALASKATGYPIAKIAAKLATGLTLVDIKNDITVDTPAAFEPMLDYVVVKVPRFTFEKFPGSSNVLSTQMKSVGETMAIGRTFVQSFQKALRSLETSRLAWCCDGKDKVFESREALEACLRVPTPDRVYAIYSAFKAGMSVDEINALAFYDKWFLWKLEEVFKMSEEIATKKLSEIDSETMFVYKKHGFSDLQLGFLMGEKEEEVRRHRKALKIVPVHKMVDTCAAEFKTQTPYLYSSYDSRYAYGTGEEIASGFESETPPMTGKEKIVILGGGPNRIGQGIEFDYCCVHACFALRDAGYETVMINSNPETVSTDYDTSDRLYFEPLTFEDVLAVIEAEKPDGIIVAFGGQTPLNLARKLETYFKSDEAKAAGVNCKVIGTSPDSIDAASDRDRFQALCKKLQIRQPNNGIARSFDEALSITKKIGFPAVVRPSYVLGGRGMEIVFNDEELSQYMKAEVVVESEHPVLIDKFLERAVEVDVDAIRDMQGNFVIGGIMEHIEEAGIHSGDSACSLPTVSLSYNALVTIRSWTKKLATELGVVGLINIQFACQGDEVFIIEANPRASRTVPFVSKAIGRPLAKIASLVMAGQSLKDLGFMSEIIPRHFSVKEAVLPFDKFPGADILLSPEMRSTGEVMGIDQSFGMAYAKAQLAAGMPLKASGSIYIDVNVDDLPAMMPIARDLLDMDFKIVATRASYAYLIKEGFNPPNVGLVLEETEGGQSLTEYLKEGEIVLFVTTPSKKKEDGVHVGRAARRAALAARVPVVTTMAAARAVAQALRVSKSQKMTVSAMQDYHSQPEY